MWTARLAYDTIQLVTGISFCHDFNQLSPKTNHYPKLPANATIEQGASILLDSLISKLDLLRNRRLPFSDLENKINEGKNLILRFLNSPNGALGMNRVMNFLRSNSKRVKEGARAILSSKSVRFYGLSWRDSTGFKFDKVPYDPNISKPHFRYKAIDIEGAYAVLLLIALRSAEVVVECAKKHPPYFYGLQVGMNADVVRIIQSAEDQYSIPDFQAKVMRQFKEELDFCRKELLDKREDIVEVVEAKIARLKQM